MARRGELRASDEDRERIITRLHRAATEGRLVAEELEQRVATALKARTYGELDAVVADLPGPRSSPRRAVPASRSRAQWALTTLRAYPMLIFFAIPVVAVTFALLVAATVMWATLMIVVLVLGGRVRGPQPPWMIGRRGHWHGPPRRRPRNHWA